MSAFAVVLPYVTVLLLPLIDAEVLLTKCFCIIRVVGKGFHVRSLALSQRLQFWLKLVFKMRSAQIAFICAAMHELLLGGMQFRYKVPKRCT